MILGIYLIAFSIMIPVWIICGIYSYIVKKQTESKRKKIQMQMQVKEKEGKTTMGFTTERGQWK